MACDKASRCFWSCRKDRLFTCFLIAYALLFTFFLSFVPLPKPRERSFFFTSFTETIGIASISNDFTSPLSKLGDNAFPHCAINFYGLPRSFKSLVLPSIIQNVLLPNARYHCDFFIHSHIREVDPGGRDDRSGTINVEEIFLLKDAIQAVHNNYINALMTTRQQHVMQPPLVVFTNTTEEEFHHQYKSFLHEIHTARGPDGHLLYVPYRHASYKNDTIDNILKMWNGQESVWKSMMTQGQEPSRSSQKMQQTMPKHYSRVAMLRSDVVFVTPIDIFKIPKLQKSKQRRKKKKGFFSWLNVVQDDQYDDDDKEDEDDGSRWDGNNSVAVIPNFARHPVNDRMIYGPYDAVRIWASERFQRLPTQHLRNIRQSQQEKSNNTTSSTALTLQQGDGIHSERFLYHTIFPAIRDAGIEIRPDPDLCFLRARADESIRFADCGLLRVTHHNHQVVEAILNNAAALEYEAPTTVQRQQRQCLLNTTLYREHKLVQLECRRQGYFDLLRDSNRNNETKNRHVETKVEALKKWKTGCDPTKQTTQKPCPKEHEAWLLHLVSSNSTA